MSGGERLEDVNIENRVEHKNKRRKVRHNWMKRVPEKKNENR